MIAHRLLEPFSQRILSTFSLVAVIPLNISPALDSAHIHLCRNITITVTHSPRRSEYRE